MSRYALFDSMSRLTEPKKGDTPVLAIQTRENGWFGEEHPIDDCTHMHEILAV
jgi:hypothetical protein